MAVMNIVMTLAFYKRQAIFCPTEQLLNYLTGLLQGIKWSLITPLTSFNITSEFSSTKTVISLVKGEDSCVNEN